MIQQVRLVRFKRFDDERFDLSGDAVFLAGPNNAGKTTLLHALSAWDLAVRRWLTERADNLTSKKRISILLDEFTALPLRAMNLLWLNRHTAKAAVRGTPKAAPIYIEVTAALPQQAPESLTIEFLYANEKLMYVRPVRSPDDPQPIDALPGFTRLLKLVHVPAFSGIATLEARHAPGMQSKLVGEGRAGEVVRNLLLDIWTQSNRNESAAPWSKLAADVSRLFQCDLVPPQFSESLPYIICEYRPRTLGGPAGRRSVRLDIANAGSGFHQVLLLLSFFYARPSSVLLLDEPDAHLHFILQGEIADHLRSVARSRGCKLVMATHAEVLLNSAEVTEIISFVGPRPRRLVEPQQKRSLNDSLRTLSSLDLLQASQVGAILYVEDESDQRLLREWSQVLSHASHAFLSFPYVWPMGGKGGIDRARRHFQCLRHAFPQLRGVCLLDRDDEAEIDNRQMPQGLLLCRWGRYEIENYLLVLPLLRRFVTDPPGSLGDLFGRIDAGVVDSEFASNFPAGADWLSDIPAITQIKGSEFLERLFAKTSRTLQKRDFFMIAAAARPDEIHPDVCRVLDAIASAQPSQAPAEIANATLADDGIEGSEDVGESDP